MSKIIQMPKPQQMREATETELRLLLLQHTAGLMAENEDIMWLISSLCQTAGCFPASVAAKENPSIEDYQVAITAWVEKQAEREQDPCYYLMVFFLDRLPTFKTAP